LTNHNPVLFRTHNIKPPHQLDAWRDWFSPVFEVGSRTDEDAGFLAQNEIWDLGSLLVSRVTAPPVSVTRSKANISKAPADHWVLSVCRNGSTMIETRGAQLSVPSGIPYIWSLGHPSNSQRSHVERLQVILPREEFRDIAPVLDSATGTILNNPLGGLLADYLLAIDRWLPTIDAEDYRRVAVAMRSMFLACIAPSSDRLAAAESGVGSARKERVRRIVHQQLRTPEFSPAELCRMGGISRSQLYRLFEHDGGVVRYIQKLRLQAAYAILSDPSSTRRIYEIATDFCFQDASTFTRAFRQEFHCAPRDVRAAALDSILPATKTSVDRQEASSCYVDLLG